MGNNDFYEDLGYSLGKDKEELFSSVYKKFFPKVIDIEYISNLDVQKKGIYVIVTYNKGCTTTIDEKLRRKDYGDILLELVSKRKSDAIDKKGWLFTCQSEYIAYGIETTGKVYMLPVPLLKRAWITNRISWKNKYGQKIAPNRGYDTVSIHIPTQELLDAVGIEIVQTFMGK